MSYTGQAIAIPFGQGGLHTDDSQDKIGTTSLIEAKNIQMIYGMTEKIGGSKRWNPSFPFPSPVISCFDWWPNDLVQRMIAICSNGKIYKQINGYVAPTEITVTGTATATIQPRGQIQITPGGNEVAGSARKLFVFTGQDPVQVISGDNNTRAVIASPALDWTGTNQPTFSVIHRGRHFAFGNLNFPHFVYASPANNHEDFQSSSFSFYNVYPGEGERLLTAWVFKGRLFVAKYPRGVYYLVDTDTNSANWYFTKLNTNFGVASAHSAIEVLDDMLIANYTGSITSMTAAFQLGDIKAGDLLNSLRNEQYMRFTTSQLQSLDRWGVYYEDKKQAYFTYRSPTSVKNNRILIIDANQKGARVMWSDKDQPNCLSLQKDLQFINRPIYGADDGHIYIMDSVDKDAPIQSPVAPITAILAVAGALSVGNYYHVQTFIDENGFETLASPASNVTQVVNAGTAGKVIVNLATDSLGRAVARKLYRTSASTLVYGLVATISDNTTKVYLDNIADASLGAVPPVINTTKTAIRARFQTPHMDFGDSVEKNFDFVELNYEACGQWDVSMNVWIDGILSETVAFQLSYGDPLDSFQLDVDRLGDRAPRQTRKPIHGKGRTISLEFYQNGLRQNFKITAAKVYFRPAGQAQRDAHQ